MTLYPFIYWTNECSAYYVPDTDGNRTLPWKTRSIAMLVKESLEKQLRTSLVPASETCGEDKYQKINAYANIILYYFI